MTSALRSWHLLIGLKERRAKHEREVVRIKSTALDVCTAELERARDQLSHASSQHAQARQRMMDKLGGTESFKPEIVPRLRDEVQRCEQIMQSARAEAKIKGDRFVEAQEALRQAKAVVARIDGQLQQARERLKEALEQAERDSDDATDEEAEETAVARMRVDPAFVEVGADAETTRRRPC